MKLVKSLVFLMSLTWATASGQRPGITVYGRFMSDVILPCTFQPGDYLFVYWYKDRKDNMVHRNDNGLDQLHDQMDQFKGRTSLFHDQLTTGNASLLLKKVQVSDGGRYECYTSQRVNETIQRNEPLFINLEVFETSPKPSHYWIPLLIIAVVLLLCFCLFLALVRRCLTPAPQRNEGEQRMEAPEILPLYNNEQIRLEINGNSEEMMNREGPGTTESEAVVHFLPSPVPCSSSSISLSLPLTTR